MADPQKYEITYSFSGFQASNPDTPLPAADLDNELQNVAVSIDQIVDALADVRREDGALPNGVVTLESLSAEVTAELGGQGPQGVPGADGAAATVAIGTVTTLAPGGAATVTNVGTSSAAIFDFAIPRGFNGTGAGDMTAAVYDPQSIGADAFSMGSMTETATKKVMSDAERDKLAGIASGATANSADATLLARANHTGEQAISTITGLQTALDAKVETTAIGTTVQPFDADTLKSDVDKALTAGYTATAVNDGTKSSGTYKPVPTSGNLKRAVNGGAHTLAAPDAAGDYTIVVQYTNNASAGAITLSGFSKTTGDAFTTTNGHDFFVYITKINGFTHAHTVALQ